MRSKPRRAAAARDSRRDARQHRTSATTGWGWPRIPAARDQRRGRSPQGGFEDRRAVSQANNQTSPATTKAKPTSRGPRMRKAHPAGATASEPRVMTRNGAPHRCRRDPRSHHRVDRESRGFPSPHRWPGPRCRAVPRGAGCPPCPHIRRRARSHRSSRCTPPRKRGPGRPRDAAGWHRGPWQSPGAGGLRRWRRRGIDWRMTLPRVPSSASKGLESASPLRSSLGRPLGETRSIREHLYHRGHARQAARKGFARHHLWKLKIGPHRSTGRIRCGR